MKGLDDSVFRQRISCGSSPPDRLMEPDEAAQASKVQLRHSAAAQ